MFTGQGQRAGAEVDPREETLQLQDWWSSVATDTEKNKVRACWLHVHFTSVVLEKKKRMRVGVCYDVQRNIEETCPSPLTYLLF